MSSEVAGPRRRRRPMSAEDRQIAAARKAKRRKIRAKLKRLRNVRAKIAQLKIARPPRWVKRVEHLRKVAGKIRRELRQLGYKFPKKAKNPADPYEETEESGAADEGMAEPAGGGDAEDNVPEEEEPEEDGDGGNAANEVGGDCKCRHRNWLHGDVEGDGKKRWSFKAIVQNLTKGAYGAPQALGSQGMVRARPGQRAMIVDVAPGLHLVQFVPETMVPKNALGADEVGILPLLMLPGVVSKVAQFATQNRVQQPLPGQQGHPSTPPVPPPQPTKLAGDDETAGRRGGRGGARRRRPAAGGRRRRAECEEE